MKTFLITGSNGLLGQKLLQILIHTDHVKVIGTGIGNNRFADEGAINFKYYNLDICNAIQVDEVIAAVKPTHIIHTAAMTNVDACELNEEACFLNNVIGTQYLISASLKLNVRPHFINLSTDFIFDGTAGPYTETDLPNPLSIYATSKLEAEKLVETSGLDWATVRTVLVYGLVPNMSRSNIVLWIKDSLEQGKKINVVADQFRTPTLAEDLAQGCLLIAFKNAMGVYNISGKDFMHINELAHRVASFWKLDSSLINESSSADIMQPAKRPPVTGFKLDKAYKELNYKPHSLEEGFKIIDDQLNKK